ncbi:M1 family metallopeptidase [Capnocytophaga cynodegmi]|uniref:M1 family metallopeptidase n=1 Tax=Capnocytophaga cynodegmi TaxID=28189 RepID=UPI001AD34434|nr:M1 family metallopeptidase [Capnocytophaga cynodegmi]GIM53835.1 aminopeptidase [Capnocytophaga cynodegmi]
MNRLILSVIFLCYLSAFAQEKNAENTISEKHTERGMHNPFRRMYQEFASPNQYRTASGAPGPAYYQQQADYTMQIEIDDENQKLYGKQTITYHNNSPESLEYLWLQLDQNRFAPESPSKKRDNKLVKPLYEPKEFVNTFMTLPFEGGFKIENVKDFNGKPLPYAINQTMMRVDLEKPLAPNTKISFSMEWNYQISDYKKLGGRSGYEYFEKDDNYLYVIAQFFPRMAMYNDVEGWQNQQFWGNGEFALPFGNYDVSITVPSDHLVEATGELQNRKEVFTPEMLKRYALAEKSFDKPVIIATQQEAEAREKSKAKTKKTWRFKAQNVRDFAFSSSRKFIYDAMAVKIGTKNVMAISLYPKESNPLWGEFSTKVVAHTLKTYSKYTLDFPYPKAVSISAEDQGMEYPMICWNHGRPRLNGFTPMDVKFGMISVIIHEVGHNFFPMIVNSDERQWGWLDEGFNTFLQYLTEQEYGKLYPQDIAPYKAFPSERGFPEQITNYMSGDPTYLEPIMSNPEEITQLGENAYSKPSAGLSILRETIMGEELFDFAFKTYVQRWKFKHPTPEDFFRTMSDASGIELDWFWRTWFYTTDYVDLGIKSVKQYQVSEQPSEAVKEMLREKNIKVSNLIPLVHMVSKEDSAYKTENSEKSVIELSTPLSDYIADNRSLEEQAVSPQPNYFYEVTFEKLGGVPMPILLEINYEDNTSEMMKFPVQVWRLNNKEFTYVITSNEPIKSFTIDPQKATADINKENNTFIIKD